MYECVKCGKWEIWEDGFNGKYYFYICSNCGYVEERKEEREL